MLIDGVKFWDDKIIVPFQWLSNKYTQLTGNDHFNLARFGYIACFAGYTSQGLMSSGWERVFWLCCGAGGLLGAWPAFLEMARATRVMERGHQNPYRSAPNVIFRYLLTCAVSAVILSLIFSSTIYKDGQLPSMSGAIFYWIHLYILACDIPPPPQEQVSGDLAWNNR